MIAIETSEHLAHSASEAIKTFTFFNHNTATWQLVAVYRLALQRCSVVFWNTQNTSESLGTAERPKKPTQVYSLPPTWVPTLKIEIGDDDQRESTTKRLRNVGHAILGKEILLCCVVVPVTTSASTHIPGRSGYAAFSTTSNLASLPPHYLHEPRGRPCVINGSYQLG